MDFGKIRGKLVKIGTHRIRSESIGYDMRTSDAFRKDSVIVTTANRRYPMFSGSHPILSDHIRKCPKVSDLCRIRPLYRNISFIVVFVT